MRARVFTSFITLITMLAAIVPQTFAVSVDYTMQIGDTRTIYANVAGYSNVTGGYWSSNSPAVEIVSQSSAAHMCTVKAVESTGSTYAYVEYRFTYTISASTGMTATGMKGYRIAVEAPEPESVGLSPARLSMQVGEGAQLTPSLYPADAETTYSYSSGNIDVATVSQSGYVTAVGGGSTYITVTTANGKTAQTSVSVSYPALRVVSVSPSGGVAEAEPDTDVVFTFNTRIEKGTDFDSIALSDLTDGTVTDTVCSISGKTLTINPVQELKAGHSYRAEIPEGAVTNPDGATITGGYFVEFSVKAMSITQTTPENGSEGVSVSEPVTIEFDREVEAGENWKNISLSSQYGAAEIEKSISEKTITISHDRLMNNTKYTLTIPIGALKNSEGGSNTVEYYLVFTTEKSDINFVGSVPENGAAGVDTDADISVSFDYELSEGESFSSISLKECIWNTEVDVAVSIDGSKVLFVPSSELERGVTYELSIPKGAVKNSEGFINEQTIVIRFTTADTTAAPAAPVISPNGGSIGSGSAISISAEDGASIYYTLNGGAPETEGELYSEPITADKDLRTVRAVAVKDGAVSGEERADFSVTDTITAVFGGSENDYFYDAAFDGSSVVAVGYSDGGFGTGDLEEISGSGFTDAVIVKYDSSMQREWVKTYGGSGSDKFYGVAAVSDGYVAVGNTYRTGMVNTGVIRKYGKDGDIKWTKYINTGNQDDLRDVIAASDGGVIAVGMRGLETTGTTSTDFSDALLQKYTSSGTVSWSRTADNGRNESFNSVAADDTVIFCAGHASESIYADKYAAVSAYTSAGVFKWSDTLDSDIVSEFTAAAVAPDGCIAAGYYDNRAFIRKYSTNGEILWTKTLEVNGSSCFNSIIADESGITALGYASESCIGSGDLSDAAGKGGNDMLMVRYDHDGNILSYKIIGGEGGEVILGADAYSDGIIAAGYTTAPGSGDFAGLDGHGGNDAVIMRVKSVYKIEYQDLITEYADGSYRITDQIPQKDGEVFAGWTDDEYMKYAKYEPGDAVEIDSDMKLYPVWESEAAQTGSVNVSSDATAVQGGTVNAGLYFVPDSDTVSVNIKLVYPSCISFAGTESGFDGLYIYEKKETETNELTVSCDLSSGAVGALTGEGCSLARLAFTVSEECANGLYEIEFDGSECFTVDSSYQRREFGTLNGCGFTVSAPKARELFIKGLGRISGEYTYSVSAFPASADAPVQWSVSDTDVAVIDQNGKLTPFKNGSVEITAETSDGLKASRMIVIDGLRTYITALQSDTGEFARDYSESELERVLYVDENVKSVRLTAEYSGGLLKSENGILYSGIAKEFNIASLPQVIELTKTEDGFSDTVYTVTIKVRATEYSVEFVNYDGSVLQTVSAEEGAIPQYMGQIPIRPEDERFRYIFSGWSPEIVPAEGNAVYTAQYRRLPRIYSVELSGSSVSVCVPEACECAAAVASYDNGRLTGLEIHELVFTSAGERVIETELKGDIKVMLWSGMDDMIPLADIH